MALGDAQQVSER